jgi:putative flippase GtrA
VPARDRAAFLRFLAAGATNTLASYALFVGLERLMPYLGAYAIAYLAGVALSYLFNTAFVFRVRRRWATALRFPLVYLVQFGLGSAVIALLVEALDARPPVAALAAILVTTPITFCASRLALSD